VLAFDTTTRNKVGEWNIETTSKGRSWLTSVSALVIPPDDPNMVWVGTPGQGIWRINLSANRVEKARSRLGLPGEIPDLAPSCFLFDRTGILWVGDSRYGLGKYSRFNHRFMLYRHNPLMSNSLSDNYIRGMFRNRDGFLWVGTQYGGLNRINLATNEVTCYRHDPARSDSIPSDCVWTVYQDRGGTLWVGAIGGFGTFDPQTGRFAGLPYVTPTTLVTSVLEDRNGHLWFFNHKELLEMSPDRVILRKIPISRLFPAVTTFHSQDILEDRFGELWLAGEQAVIRFDPKTGASHVFPPVFFRQQPGGEFLPTCLMETATGELWLSTKRDGIFRYDRARDAFVGIQEKDGLPNNNVYGLLEAEDGTIWMSTDGGVCKYNPKTGQFRTFGPSDGLQGFEFNRRAFCKGPDGQMFFGGIKGLNNFFPRDIRENVTPPPVVLTELTFLKGKAWFPTSVQKELILPYDENTFTIRFAALDFNAPEKNRYSYRLVGFDDMTVETNSPEALYRNLPPGEYRFTVRGANNDGIWSSGETTLRLKVLPPWWRSWWAYFGYACAAGFLLFGGFKMQTNRLLLRSKLREAVLQSQIDAGVIQIQRIEQEALENENRRQAEANERLLEIDRIKQSFTAMLVHDIKSPLSSVKLVLDLISLENLQIVPEKRQLLEGSQRNLDQVLTLANELLDVFKSDFQEIQLIKIPVSLHDLLNRCLQVIHPAALAKGITLSHSFSDELPPISGDPGKLERVFVNLLSNAVKFTPENGTITLLATTIEGTEMEEGERSLMIRVTDTGPGIPPEDLPYIFDPYRQSTSGYRKVGVGLGLAIVKRIVAAHGGNVTVRSKVGVGSTFAVTLPLPDLTEKGS
jgi:signal transduction histidine kinase/streptogramin lyase